MYIFRDIVTIASNNLTHSTLDRIAYDFESITTELANAQGSIFDIASASQVMQQNISSAQKTLTQYRKLPQNIVKLQYIYSIEYFENTLSMYQ